MQETQKLIFVGGAPAVGKTATCERLYGRLANCICVDGDDLWCRMHPFRVDEVTVPMVEKNVVAVLGNFLEAGFDHVILCWVLHRQDLIDRLVDALGAFRFEFYSFTLVCSEETLQRRWTSAPRPRPGFAHARTRLRQTRQLTHSHLIDTTSASVEQVADTILRALAEPPTGAWLGAQEQG
jgi:broad-specificity NMP kinase